MLTRRTFLIVVLSILPGLALSEPPQSDEEKFQGEWAVEKLEVQGKSAPPEFLKTGKYVFKNQTLSVYENDQSVGVSEITVDSTQTPKTIDLTGKEGEGTGKMMFGIYKLEDDRLILCIGGSRPTEFNGAGEAGLLHLKRIMAE